MLNSLSVFRLLGNVTRGVEAGQRACCEKALVKYQYQSFFFFFFFFFGMNSRALQKANSQRQKPIPSRRGASSVVFIDLLLVSN